MPIFDKEKSKVRMAALTKNGYHDITWYSPLSQNLKPENTIIAGMKRRLEAYDKEKATQVLRFYNNLTNEIIIEYR